MRNTKLVSHEIFENFVRKKLECQPYSEYRFGKQRSCKWRIVFSPDFWVQPARFFYPTYDMFLLYKLQRNTNKSVCHHVFVSFGNLHLKLDCFFFKNSYYVYKDRKRTMCFVDFHKQIRLRAKSCLG